MNFTRQQLTILGGLLSAGYLACCGFGYMIGRETAPTRAPPQPPAVASVPTTEERAKPTSTQTPKAEAPAPTDTPAPTDKLIPPTPPTTPIPPTSTPTPVPLLSATPDIAGPNTAAVTFTGTVTDVNDRHRLLGAGVRVGNPITGTVFYTLGKSDQDPLPHQGQYDFAYGEIRFVIQIGEDIFDTGLNGDGRIATMDNHPQHGDYVVFHSSTNIPPSEDMRLRIVSISMQDSQPNPDAVQSDALPSGFHPADWDLIYLALMGDREIYYPDYDYTEDQRYSVRADIVSAETSVVPIPVRPTNAPIPPSPTPCCPLRP